MVKIGKLVLGYVVLIFALLATVGCGSDAPAEFPQPLGASNGKNTFILFYTEN